MRESIGCSQGSELTIRGCAMDAALAVFVLEFVYNF